MNVIQYFGPFGNGLEIKVAAVAAIVAIADALFKIFGGRIPKFIVNYMPIIIAMAGAAIAELIASGKFSISKEIFYSGLMAYSVGTVVSVGIRKLIRGEKTENSLLMLVQGIAENICVQNAGAEYAEIVNILKTLAQTDRSGAKSDITAQLKKVAKENVSDAEILAAAEIILLSAQNLIKEK